MGDVASIAALALIAGFTFVEFSNLTRYCAARAEGQRLLSYSAFAAVVLLLAARVCLVTLGGFFPSFYGGLRDLTWAFFPGPGQPWFSTALAAFALGLVGIAIANQLVDRDKASTQAIESRGNELERLLLQAFQRFPALVAVTLKNDKVYIGWPVKVPPILEGETQYIRLLPAMSGYRTAEKHTLELTTDYTNVYEQFSPEIDRAMFRPGSSRNIAGEPSELDSRVD